MADSTVPAALNVGFLTVVEEPSGELGGYLVTNGWGRPLEFRLSTAVQPSRVQRILYGRTLQSYVYADLIGKTLVEKTGTPVQLLVTDRQPALELRWSSERPVVWLAKSDDPQATALAQQGSAVRPPQPGRALLICHPRYPGDVPVVRALVERVEDCLDLTEPFGRIREAIGEARKLGVTNRN